MGVCVVHPCNFGVPMLWHISHADLYIVLALPRSRDREDGEDDEESYERKKLERRLRDKEAAYQEVRWLCTALLVSCVMSLKL